MGRIWYALIANGCWAVFKLGFGLRVSGAECVPRVGAVLLLASHTSHLDPILVGTCSRRRLRYLARDSLFFFPLGLLIRSLGAIPIHREGAGIGGLKATLQVLRKRDALLLFPEGTRSHDGKLQPLKPGFCAVARRSDATIVPVGIVGAFEALPRGSSFPRFSRICLHFGPAISQAEISELSERQVVDLMYHRIAAAQQLASKQC